MAQRNRALQIQLTTRSRPNVSVVNLLLKIDAPVWVLHVRSDQLIPFEEVQLMAPKLPNSRFVSLEGRNHVLVDDEPAGNRFVDEVQRFLASIE